MRILTLIILLLLAGIAGKGQTYTGLKNRSKSQDSLLDVIFQRYRKAQDSVADIKARSMSIILMDSADRYTSLSAGQIDKQNLDSAIYMIHVANWFINNSQSLLHMGKEWIYSRPTY
jgi:hypothetical protein